MIVYKYRPVDKYTLELLINNEFHLSSPKEFNDPFDSWIYYDFSGSKDEILKRFEELGPEILTQELKDAFERVNYDLKFLDKGVQESMLQDELLVACFSEVKDNILLWSHYADCHKGVALGFEVITVENYNFLRFEDEVNFASTRIPKTAYELEKVKYDFPNRKFHVFEDHHSEMHPYPLYKASEWSYEKEHRLIFHKNKISGPNVKFYKQNLKEIIFGLWTTEKDKETIKKIIKENYEPYSCKVDFLKCERKNNIRGLVIVPVD
jgi:hypothetical protein